MNAPLPPSFARRALLKAGGVLIVGFAFGAPRLASAAETPGSPDVKRIDSFIAIHADNTATLHIGKVELGQGNTTGLMQIVGEELEFGMDQMIVAPFVSGVTPDQGSTVASLSIREGGPQLRQAAAEARHALLQMAAMKLDVPVAELSVSRGIVSSQPPPCGQARTTTYGELIGGKNFDIAFTGTAPLKPPAGYKLVGTRVPRVDMPAKAAGTYIHMHNVRVDGMWHGRVVRPRGQGALGPAAGVLDIDEKSIAHIPNTRIVRKGNFVGVVSPNEWHAIQAAQKLRVRWDIAKTLPENADALFALMQATKPTDNAFVDKGDIPAALAQAAHKVSAQYRAPYQMHGSFAPNCAIADVRAGAADIYCSSQVPYAVRNLVANVTAIPITSIVIRRFEGAGTFGHSAYDDVAQAAAIISQEVARPVRVQFMRWDEHGWECYGPAHIGEVTAAIDAAGNIIAYDYQGWQHGWNATEPSEQLAIGTAPKSMAGGGATSVNPNCAGGMYAVANRRVLAHNLPGNGFLKASFLRSPLDVAAAFASEQTIDELALAANMDPYLFRKQNITDVRWLGVLDAAAKAANWAPRVAGSQKQAGDVVTGRGIGLGTHFTSYGAAVAEVRVNKKTGQIVATHMTGAIDCGLCINPGLVENQISGMMMQAASRMLHEEVAFNGEAVTSLDWNGYPVLQFDEHPDVTAVIVQRLDQPCTGAGEEVLAAGGAALANAVFDAIGVRLRQFPLTPQRVRAALSA